MAMHTSKPSYLMNLKRFTLTILVFAFGFTLVSSPEIQARKWKANMELSAYDNAALTIRRTNLALRMARQQLLDNEMYTGLYAEALTHQMYAVQLHESGQFAKADEHSLYARKLAYMVESINTPAAPGMSSDAKVSTSYAPTTAERNLDDDLRQSKMKRPEDDEAALEVLIIEFE